MCVLLLARSTKPKTMSSDSSSSSRQGLLITTAVVTVALASLFALRQRSKLAQGFDRWAWLEDVQSERSLAHVRAQNLRAVSHVGEPSLDNSFSRILSILDSKDKIPYAALRGPKRFMNLWKDENHPRGLWRRVASLEELKNPDAAWETVLDIDALDKAEQNPGWVWKGYTPLEEGDVVPLCLVKLSRGGADAVEIREFDLDSKQFVQRDGKEFFLPEAKSSCSYKDRDTLLVGSDFGPGSLTDSGYPRVIREWRRGTPLATAPVVFQGLATDVSVSSWYEADNRGFAYEWRVRSMTFYSSEHLVRIVPAKEFVKIPVPEDAEVQAFADQLLFQLRSDFEFKGRTYKAGSLLATDLGKFCAGQPSGVVTLFQPTERSSLEYFVAGKTVVLLSVLDNVRSRLVRWVYVQGEWQQVDHVPIPEGGDLDKLDVWALNERTSDEFWMTATGFLRPTSLYVLDAGPRNHKLPQLIRGLPQQFDVKGLHVEQFFAPSLVRLEVAGGEAGRQPQLPAPQDGTLVPYFQVSKKGAEGPRPTLLYAYGGFEISMLPRYSAVVGVSWLEKGGTYVMACIRGGGEFGPTWHQAALKEKRHKAFEDFEAVALHLQSRNVATPRTLGIMGGSNGGLLMGNAFVRSPQLWGAVVCEVPLLDMRRFSHLLAGASWMAEYGDPDDEEQWKWLQKYSPYHNVRQGAQYPAILFTTSTRDDRVHPAHARKMAAKLIEMGFGSTTWSYENVEGGHGGAADNRQMAFLEVLAFRFLRAKLGVKEDGHL
jgi:prolyl oligopeptidase